MNVTAYRDYFRTLARLNKKLRHDPAYDLPEAAAGVKRFTFFSQSELISSKLRTGISPDAVLHLHMYDWTLTDNQAYDVRRQFEGGFIVSQHAAPNNEEQMEQAYANTEAIVWELLSRMRVDYFASDRCSLPFGKPDFNKTNVTCVGPLWDNRFGWFVTFPFEVAVDGSPAAFETIVNDAFLT